MTMPDKNALPAYHVTGQRLTGQLTNSGSGFRDVWEVTYEVDSGPAAGTTGHVNVPAAQYNANVVRATIEGQLVHVHNVASL